MLIVQHISQHEVIEFILSPNIIKAPKNYKNSKQYYPHLKRKRKSCYYKTIIINFNYSKTSFSNIVYLGSWCLFYGY